MITQIIFWLIVSVVVYNLHKALDRDIFEYFKAEHRNQNQAW